MNQQQFMAVAAALAIAGSSVVAQRGQGASSSAGPAVAMLYSGPLGATSSGRLDVVSTLPADFPLVLLPPGSVIGAIGVGAEVTVVVSALPPSAAFDQTRFGWSLDAAGWLSASVAPQGFSSGPPRPQTFCRAQDFATYSILSGAGSDRWIRIAVGPDSRRSCAPALGVRPLSDVPIPLLDTPVGVHWSNVGGGGSLDDYESRARVDTTMSLGELSAHFLPQMTAASWKLEGTSTGDPLMLVTRYSSVSKAGDSVTAILMFTTLGRTGTVEAVFRVVRDKPAARAPVPGARPTGRPVHY